MMKLALFCSVVGLGWYFSKVAVRLLEEICGSLKTI